MKRRNILYLCFCMLLLCGCARGKALNGNTEYIYYINTESIGLVKEECSFEGKTVKEKIEFVFRELQKETDSIDYKSAYPEMVKIKGWKLNDSDLEIDFESSYRELDTTKELLLRAATVQTMVQIAGVDYVRFWVDGEPLKDSENNEIGYMSKESFVDNTGSSLHCYQDGNLRLFFANKSGDQLVEEERSVRYNSNISVEKLIVEQLQKGPSIDGAYPVIPPEAKLLSVAVRDGICYVNFDEGFLNMAYSVTPQVMIYSIVNSIVEEGEVSKVQILINGETTVQFQGNISFGEPFTRNLDLVQKEEKEEKVD